MPLKQLLKTFLNLDRRAAMRALLTHLAAKGNYKMCARLFSWRLRRVRANRGPAKPAYQVVYLEKGGFKQDMLDSLGQCPKIALLRARRQDLQAIYAAFLPEHVHDYNYRLHDTPEILQAKQAYREFLRLLWLEVLRRRKIDAVLSGNIVYYAEREFSAALESVGTPFIVAHKECLKTPGAAEYFLNIYRTGVAPFHGRRILVYNAIERDNQAEAGVAAPDRFSVVGIPRLDRYHVWRRAQAGRSDANAQPPQALVFMFTPKTGLFRLAPDKTAGKGAEKLLFWEQLLHGVVQAVLKLATEHPDIRVVLKSKGIPGGVPALQRQIFGDQPTPPNLAIVTGGDPFQLITQSRVVCGFNTTSLFEALAAGIPVVAPRFGEVHEPSMKRFLVNMEDAVEYADSAEDLARRLYQLARAPRLVPKELEPRQVRMLDKWLGNGDGKAGERMTQAVLEELKAALPLR